MSQKRAQWIVCATRMLHHAWHAGHDPHHPSFLLCPSLGTPCNFAFTPTNNDFWPVVLSASLQAFYTIYTAVLLFLTQRLAISRTLVRRVKLTAVHDISGAWAGLGSALTAYLASISMLHVTSSTLLQFQTFNASMTTLVPTTLGWLNDSSHGYLTDLGPITTSLPVVKHLTGLVSAGLSNTTLYDTLKRTAIAGNATVNATTVASSCGLVPNVTYSADANTAIVPSGPVATRVVIASALWPDQIHIIPWIEFEDSSSDASEASVLLLAGVYLMVSTLLGIDPSVQDEVAINMTWNIPDRHSIRHPGLFRILLAVSEHYTWGDRHANQQPTESYVLIAAIHAMGNVSIRVVEYYQLANTALATPDSTSGILFDPYAQITELSVADEYIMSLVGLNLTEEYTQFRDGAYPISNFTLSPDELEFAVARAAAQLIWLAGQMGTANGGIDPGNGTAYVNEEFIALRLNINLLPLAFAASASVIMLGLALHMTRAFHASHDSQAAISNIGVLQLLWLGHRSASINEVLEDVQHPTEANLRRAGMIDVCLTKTISDKEEFGSSTDSLSLCSQLPS
ncbi:uncharacterized protein HD556DRAFT_1537271 [Suillus plorans]|uniref:Uncharacterized protein n=1 Tax=Suillus plorans TaxID=116603 RepID=A0A9P7AKU0_9AGAM|nr:uncharacterized protein HD556DRAFT_1313576 [Suillus plorans]XP_041158331.1 uncharacterized protein HD556DRAFT_1537271 [Suillus plorans]KAG1786331.1 hypothetical protein HD556DRAFT_1313576 [Suillus plorans]KAG1791525.1 hypothetical protein HD556DRAFT_1537271 [Suillus plorans]